MTAGPPAAGAASLAYLVARAELVEDRVRALVQRRRADDPAPDDPFRGLYVNEQTVDQLLEVPADPGASGPDLTALAAVEAAADQAEATGEAIRLRRLAHDAALTALDTELLLIALLPDLDTRFERLFGYLNDDVTRRRASVGLALELAGPPPCRRLPALDSKPAGRCCGTGCWSSRIGTGRC